MTKPIPNGEPTRPPPTLRVRLPGFIKDEEVGLGEVVKRATYALGFRPLRRLRGAGDGAQPPGGLYPLVERRNS